MKLCSAVLSGIFLLSNAVYAQNHHIYKCTSAGTIEFSDTPCISPQREQPPGMQAQSADHHGDDGKPLDPWSTRLGVAPLSATRLFIGMTDTQVLNLASWGRPAQITRGKTGHIWHEEWDYNDPVTGDVRQALYFENARLVAQKDVPLTASLEARATTE